MLEGCDEMRSYRIKIHLLALGFFTTLTFAVFWNYFSGSYPLGTDALGLPTDLAMMDADGSYFSAWRAYISMGSLNYPSPILSAFYYVVNVLHIAPLDFARGMLVTSFLFSGVMMYLCAYKLIGNWTAGLVAGSIYSLNQVALSQVLEAHYFFVIGYALFPLLFLVFFQAMRNFDRRSAILLPIVAVTFGSISAPHTVLISAIYISLFSAVYMLVLYRRGRRSDHFHINALLPPAIVFGVCILLMVLPITMMRSLGEGVASLHTIYPIEEAASYSSYTIINSLALGSSENTFVFGTTNGEWTVPGFLWPLGLLVAMVIPIMALLSVLLKSKRDLVLPLLIPALIFVVIATGPNSPLFGDVFTWAFRTIPLMDSIRAYSRFLLLTAFSFSMLIGLVFSNLDEIRNGLGTRKIGKLLNRTLATKKTVAILLAVSLVFPSGVAFSGEFRSFNLPTAYSEPYEWLNKQDGDFRLITLPLCPQYYETGWTRVGGYPDSKTSDVGLFSPLVSGKPLASGMESIDYWNFITNAMNKGDYGYRDIAQLLGSTAGVQYIVAQVYASQQEIQEFESLDGVTVLQRFDGGATVLLNSYYTQRVHALSELQLTVGGRDTILTALGLNVTDQDAGRVMVNQLGEYSLEQLLPYFSKVILRDGDVTELLAWTGNWSEQERIELANYGDMHTRDSTGVWVWSDANYSLGISSQPTVETTGKASLTIPVDSEGGNSSLLVKAVYGPLAGEVDVLLDGVSIGQLSLRSNDLRTDWVTFSNLAVSKGAHEVTFTNVEGNNSLEMMLFAPQSKIDEQSSMLSELLDEYKEKVTVTISGADSSAWTSGFPWSGEKGNGIAPMLSMDAATISGSAYLVHDPISQCGTAQALTVDTGPIRSLPIGGYQGGESYEAQLSLRLNGTAAGEVCRIDVVDPQGGTLIASKYVMADELSNDTYSSVPVDFVAPSNMVQFTITPLTSNATVNWSNVEVTPEVSRPLEAQLEFLSDGTYSITIDADDPENISVSLDHTALELIENRDGLLTYEARNITTGLHTLQVQSSAVYALDYSLEGSESVTGDCNVEYERLSNTQYNVQLNCTGPTWLLVSEGYDPMWDAKIDGEELIHLPIDSIVNAYYVPAAGNHTIEITYSGQLLYEDMSQTLILATVASIAILWVLANRKDLVSIIAGMKRHLRI